MDVLLIRFQLVFLHSTYTYKKVIRYTTHQDNNNLIIIYLCSLDFGLKKPSSKQLQSVHITVLKSDGQTENSSIERKKKTPTAVPNSAYKDISQKLF